MENLIDISGWADSYASLCNKDAMEGEFYNVLEDGFFSTYRKTGDTEIGDTNETTDVVGWYQVFAQLKSAVPKPNDGDVYIVGMASPYTRYKAIVRGVDVNWVEDGEEEKRIVRNYKRYTPRKDKQTIREGEFFSVGNQPPYHIYGLVSEWEYVGHIISNTKLYGKFLGEVAFYNGMFYIHSAPGHWDQLNFPEPIENYTKHTYVTKDGTKCRIREGFTLGTLEFYTPKE